MTPGVEKRIASQGVYSIPRAILDRNWHVFEAGLDAEPPLDPGEIARARFFRRVNRAVAVGFFGVLVAALAVLFWFGMPLWRVLQFTFVVAFVGAILFKVAV
ncbi:hypothetical protein [Halorussus halophilus]|uniref:hypothetical protein n=1 Tax=Halorussus halophilus TaxID=2650975 RepID=UPI001300FF72|nr:hypothetical protein [Halorussus halophilus]